MSVEATALVAQLNGVFEQREQELELAQANLKQQIEALESEKKLMQTKAVTDRDIVDLNVGGTVLSTMRSTLTQAEGSALAAMFSGRWEHCLKLDAENRIFLDFDPYCFQEILSHLRCCNIRSSAAADVPLPAVSACKQAAYMQLVKYLALEDYMGYSAVVHFRFSQAAPGVEVSPEGEHADCPQSTPDYKSIILDPPIRHVGYVKYKIHKTDWLFLGVGANVNIADPANYSAAGSNGWTSNQFQWTQGKHESAPILQWHEGDWVLIKADMGSGTLSMIASSVTTPFTLPLSTIGNGQYVFHVILHDSQNTIDLLPVTPEDQQLLP